MATIRWWGHACFEIIHQGVSLVIDPHDGESIGLKRPGTRADYVIMSHDHFDHNASGAVLKQGGRSLMMALGDNSLGPFRARGVQTFHDKERGKRRGRNTVYVVETPDGLRILHAGDLGHVLEQDHIKAVGRVDLALLPVGGTFTIDHEEALQVFRALGARAAIPMHYWVKGLNLPLAAVDKFVSSARAAGLRIYWIDSNEVEISEEKGALKLSSPSSCREEGSPGPVAPCSARLAEASALILRPV